MFITILTFLVTISFAIYAFCNYRFSFWKRKGIDYLNPTFPFGDMSKLWNGVPISVQFEQFYTIFKSRDQNYGGIFQFFEPTFVPISPEIIKDILIRDFSHFNDRGIYVNIKDQPIIKNIFFAEGSEWRTMRGKLSPTYTAGKMKMMFKTMLACTTPLQKRIKILTDNFEIVDMKDISARFTTDVIGSCAFGIECNSFESPNSEFRMYGKKLFDDNIFKSMKAVFRTAFPNIAKKLGMLVFEKDVENFFVKAVTDTYNFRKQNNIQRKDFMQLLIELKNRPDDPLSLEDVIAQAFIFFVAGFDTSATTLSFVLFEVAFNKEIQNKVRCEIRNVLKKYDGDVTYDGINEMKYMDKVIQETLRKYPPVAVINRKCTETYTIPNTNIILDKGTQIGIPLLGLHRDPQYYPEPDNFDPERFSDENKGNIIPGTYLPFGDGPRVCIGLRFGLMQVKIGLVSLLNEFEFSVNSKTKMPLEIELGFVMSVKGGIWLNSRKYPQDIDNITA